MYINAAKQGITEFVVPGNKIESIRAYRKLLSDYCNPIFYSPGLITQGGDINKAAKFINHLIVGRALYEAKDIARKAKEISALI
jgi:phosphoribosylformimino-5-aminoimidazole carboxamide ribonucleotide (ProFAR) isomerase